MVIFFLFRTMIQFLKGKVADEFQVLDRLEPDVQIFRFDKSDVSYCDLSESEKEEEKANILNGFNFSKKVLETGESDVIILDELLGLIDLGILTEDDVEDLLRIQGDYRKLIITGTKLPEQIRAYVDEVSEILWDNIYVIVHSRKQKDFQLFERQLKVFFRWISINYKK